MVTVLLAIICEAADLLPVMSSSQLFPFAADSSRIRFCDSDNLFLPQDDDAGRGYWVGGGWGRMGVISAVWNGRTNRNTGGRRIGGGCGGGGGAVEPVV